MYFRLTSLVGLDSNKKNVFESLSCNQISSHQSSSHNISLNSLCDSQLNFWSQLDAQCAVKAYFYTNLFLRLCFQSEIEFYGLSSYQIRSLQLLSHCSRFYTLLQSQLLCQSHLEIQQVLKAYIRLTSFACFMFENNGILSIQF